MLPAQPIRTRLPRCWAWLLCWFCVKGMDSSHKRPLEPTPTIHLNSSRCIQSKYRFPSTARLAMSFDRIHSLYLKMNKKIKLSVIIATIFALLNYVSTTIDFVGKIRSVFGETTTAPQFIGRWTTRWEYNPAGNVRLGFRGTSEYFDNGRYNTSGIMTVVADNSASETVQVEYLASWAGTWSVADKGMTTTMDQMKTTPSTIAFGTKQFSANEVMQILGNNALPNLSDLYPNGATAYATIVSVSDRTFLLTEDAGHKQKFTIFGQRD